MHKTGKDGGVHEKKKHKKINKSRPSHHATPRATWAGASFVWRSSRQQYRPSLYRTLMNFSADVPFLSALRSWCGAKARSGYLVTMHFLIACTLEPLRSFRVRIASNAICLVGLFAFFAQNAEKSRAKKIRGSLHHRAGHVKNKQLVARSNARTGGTPGGGGGGRLSPN